MRWADLTGGHIHTHTSPTMRTSEVQPLQESEEEEDTEEPEESEVENDFERGSLSSRDALN